MFVELDRQAKQKRVIMPQAAASSLFTNAKEEYAYFLFFELARLRLPSSDDAYHAWPEYCVLPL
jgi:hypothetical protein